MKYANIFYVPHFNIIGGIETYCYELAKKYKDKDITFVYSDPRSDTRQINRIRKYARVIYQPYNSTEPIKCKRLFIMYRCKIELFEAEEVIQIIHADYKAQGLKPNLDKRIIEHYGVSQAVADTFKEISGVEVGVAYNPLTIDKPKKILHLISATRLSKEKGKDRMIKLAEALDKANIPYEWRVFTNDKLPIPNPNVIYMTPRLDIRDYIADADYLVQLSDTEAFSYSVLESLCLGTPVIITDIPSFKEMGIKNGLNGYILDFSMENIPIEDIYTKVPNFTFKKPNDIYNKLLVDQPSTYNGEETIKVICKKTYTDIEINKRIQKGEELEITKSRAEYLKGLGLVEW
jgi:glycosyltransferase involved in cell wall biosynthesis